MDVWIGCSPEADPERYAARSGIHLAANVLAPLYMAHGDKDIRVPVTHSRLYVREMERLGKNRLVRYDELTGAGGYGHMTGATEQQIRTVEAGSEQNRQASPDPVKLPDCGSLFVGGHVYTKSFRIHLDSVDALATAHYDLTAREVTMYAARPYRYRLLWADEAAEEGICRAPS